MTVRLFIAIVTLLGIYAGVRWVKDRGMPSEPAKLEMKLDDLPATLGDWEKVEDTPVDKEMFEAIGAELVLERNYRDRGNRVTSLHMAAFAKSEKAQGVPHPPETCYEGHGWMLGESKLVSLDQGGGAKFLPVTRGNETAYVLYWYQVNGSTYTNGDGQRRLLLACRGQPVRPPIVKVMLQTSAASAEDAEKSLKSLATAAYTWSKDFH